MFPFDQRYSACSPPPNGNSQVAFGHSLACGLVGCWLMKQNGGIGVPSLAMEGAGTFTGTPRWGVRAGAGAGAEFQDANADYIDVANHPALELADQVSLAVGVWNDGGDVRSMFVEKAAAGAVNTGYMIFTETDPTLKFRIAKSGGGTATATGGTFAAGQYFDCVGTYDRVNLKVFRRGVEDGTTAETAAILTGGASPSMRIGRSFTTLYNVDGVIPYVYIWNRRLLPAEIQELYVNPYQFFVAVPHMRVNSAGAPAAGQPYQPWMQRGPTLAQ